MSALALWFLIGILGSGDAGTSALPLLRIGQGPRAAALGESFVSLADDASAIYWNPAGLAQFRDYRLSFSHQQWFAGITDEVLHAVVPTDPGALGFGIAFSGETGIESWDEYNVPGDTLSTWDFVLSTGYGISVVEGFSLGGALKGVCENLPGCRGLGGALDLGFLARPSEVLGAGLVARNLGVVAFPGEVEKLPTEIVLGGNLAFRNLTTTLDIAFPLDNRPNFRAGAEYVFLDALAVRLGYRTGPCDVGSLGLLSGLTTGIGVSLGALTLDYSFSPYGKLGTAHRLGIGTRIRPKGAGTLRITVLDGETMEPVKANLAFSGAARYAARTDHKGSYLAFGLNSGELLVRARSEGYLPSVDTIQVKSGEEQELAICLSHEEHGGVWGVVYDASTEKPMNGVVRYQGAESGQVLVREPFGSFALKGLLAGEYSITASGWTEEHEPQTCTLRIEPGRLTEFNFYLSK